MSNRNDSDELPAAVAPRARIKRISVHRTDDKLDGFITTGDFGGDVQRFPIDPPITLLPGDKASLRIEDDVPRIIVTRVASPEPKPPAAPVVISVLDDDAEAPTSDAEWFAAEDEVARGPKRRTPIQAIDHFISIVLDRANALGPLLPGPVLDFHAAVCGLLSAVAMAHPGLSRYERSATSAFGAPKPMFTAPETGLYAFDGRHLKLEAGKSISLWPEHAEHFSRAEGQLRPLRVFRFRDDAWQCPKNADICRAAIDKDRRDESCARVFEFTGKDRQGPARRASVSFSGSERDLEARGARIDGADVVWPDGERWPRRPRTVDVAIVGYEGTEAAEHFVANPPEAKRLSTWNEWFDLTLTKAAHEYLAASLPIRRELTEALDEALSRTGVASDAYNAAVSKYRVAGVALDRILHAYASKSMCRWSLSVDAGYIGRVKADIEARLRGEPGEVQKP